MHQKLKFNVSISKLNKWQPILATEYIGTFYMIYIMFTDKIEYQAGSAYTKCMFYLQNYRGSIRMGIKNFNAIKITEETRNEDKGFDYTLEIPVTPFYRGCDKSDKCEIVDIEFSKGLIPYDGENNHTIFETEIKYQDFPKEIFDENDLDNSPFLHPLYCFREGDNIQHIYYNKYIKGQDGHITSELLGGNFDPRGSSIRYGLPPYGSLNSPTCDAKRTDIVV